MKVIGSGSTKSIAFENGEIDYMRITTVDELENTKHSPTNTTSTPSRKQD